jgi:hypothetical protein
MAWNVTDEFGMTMMIFFRRVDGSTNQISWPSRSSTMLDTNQIQSNWMGGADQSERSFKYIRKVLQ